MKKKMKITIFAFAILAIAGIIGYNYVLYGGARDLASEKTDFAVTSKSILDEFASNMDASNKKYLEKAVAITGKVTAVNGKEIIIEQTIICNLKSEDASIKVGQNITIKGRVVGFDDLMGDLKLDQCFINNNPI